MAVCYIHGCLEFFDFHISSGKKKKGGAECWWLCPRFPELMHCLSIFFSLILLYVYSIIIARNQEGQHNAFKFRHSIQMSLVEKFWWWNLSLPYYYSVNPQVSRFLYLFTSAPQMRMVNRLPLPPLKKDKIIFCAPGSLLTQFPMCDATY